MDRLRRWRLAGMLLAMVAALAASPAGAVAQGEIDTPPTVTNVRADPSSLPAEGGLVTIFADANDDGGGIQQVQAEVQGPFGGPEIVYMDITGVGQTYAGSLTIPANFTDTPVSYRILVQAMDINGNSTWETGGGITVEAAAPFDGPPVVVDPVVQPRDLPSGGGTATIRVAANDDRGVSAVSATITRPDGSTTDVPLQPVDFTNHYEGTFAAPANTGTTAARYAITVTARDDGGQTASVDAGALTVAPAPPPPSPAKLTVTPSQLAFPTIRVGERVRQTVVVRNTGRRTTGPVRGVIAASGAGFSLVGGGPTGIAFSLRPGESTAIKVDFRPSSPGSYSGTLTVRRSDGGQPGLAVRLAGRAIPKRRG